MTHASPMNACADASVTPDRQPRASAGTDHATHAAAKAASNWIDSAGFSAGALAQWESEGGPDTHRSTAMPHAESLGSIPLTDAELMHLRVRVIALENLVIALLAKAPACQIALTREIATYICPRPGFTAHPLTLRAADEMVGLVNRANRFSTP
jgi:hypothetical protein